MMDIVAHHHIRWRQVWGLAAMVAAIVFSWMAYGFYQPVILNQLGFTQLASSLAIIQGFLGAAIEPWVGAISDRFLHRVGSRLPLIATGVTLAGLLFVAIGLLLLGDLPIGLRWIVPVLMTFWVISMIIFRGPVIALLRQWLPIEDLPAANSMITLVFGLVSAMNPVFSRIIGFLGSGMTFLLGAVILVLGAGLLWSAQPRSNLGLVPIDTGTAQSLLSRTRLRKSRTKIFVVGLITGLLVNVSLRISPQFLHRTLPAIAPEYLAAGMLLIAAGMALPLDRYRKAGSLDRTMGLGLIILLTAIGASGIFYHPLLAIVILAVSGVALGLLFITQIPWCLKMLPPAQAGLATGLYFGGMGAATALLSLLLLKSQV
jgi:MFS family permease